MLARQVSYRNNEASPVPTCLSLGNKPSKAAAQQRLLCFAVLLAPPVVWSHMHLAWGGPKWQLYTRGGVLHMRVCVGMCPKGTCLVVVFRRWNRSAWRGRGPTNTARGSLAVAPPAAGVTAGPRRGATCLCCRPKSASSQHMPLAVLFQARCCAELSSHACPAPPRCG